MKQSNNSLRPLAISRRLTTLPWFGAVVAGLGIVFAAPTAGGSVDEYDARIAADAEGGLVPAAKLTSAVVLTGTSRSPFNFGQTSGDATMEFVVQGNPGPVTGSAYLAVGTNTTSNLRYEQWQNTGQLGFTQIGVLDYLFNPGVASPTSPTHIAYVWRATDATMQLYVNGALAGTRTGVVPGFSMPWGQGWLGGNPGGSELMVGTIHRVTVYDDLVAPEVIQAHADAFNGIIRPPILVGFSASPQTLFSPASSTLSWQVLNADRVFINGTDVTGATSLGISPGSTTIYWLIATNAGGSVTGQVTVVVNPAPVIHSFSSRGYATAGETITLGWNTSYGETFTIRPGIGDVTFLTANGSGSVSVPLSATTTFSLMVANTFGSSTATVAVLVVKPAAHLVISEFMADNDSTLQDEDGEFVDWIEIHNPSSNVVSLVGHYLTDTKAEPTRWAFPNIAIPAGGHFLVFASGKDRRDPNSPLHTNFQLDRDGEYLALIGPDLSILHAFDPYPGLDAGVSFGLLGGDPSVMRALGLPTPGSQNNETPAPPPVVRFSRPSGMIIEPFLLALTSTAPAEIRFTLDDSSPTLTHGAVYTGPILIEATKRVRAVAISNGLASKITGVSFIKLAAELAGYTSTLPIMVIENFGKGIIPQKGWSTTGAGIRQVPRQSATWATFDLDGPTSSLTNRPQMISTVGIRGRGAFSSQWRQKPYSVEAVDEHGAERSVNPLGMPDHPDWILYFPDPDTNKDPTLLFNTFAYELSKNTGHYAVRFRWVEAFINEDGGDLQLADRRGVYAIVEKVSRGPDRLDFQRLSNDGTTGSWLLNINRMDPEPDTGWPAENGATQPWFFHTAGPNRIPQTPPNAQVVGDDEPQQSNGYLNFDNPNGYTINSNQRAAIEGWFKQFEDVLWNNALWRDPTNGYRKYLDPVDFADYFILNTLTRNGDGLLISMFPWKGDDGKLRMGPAWDYNWSPYFISGGPTGTLYHRPDRLWYRRLFADPDFAQLYIDRWWDHRRIGMSNADMDAIIDRQAATISGPKALLNGMPSEAEWNARLTQMKTWLKDRANWIDSNYLKPPVFSQHGGAVADGFQLTIQGTNGTIYYTLDGADPRAEGGAVAPSSSAFQAPFTISEQLTVQARIRNGTNWSGLTKASFYPFQNLSGLVVTEIMYNPRPFGAYTANDLEFMELKNTGTTPINLGGLTFSGITFAFIPGTKLLPGSFFVLARHPDAFAARYPGVTAQGTFTGQLDNAGETIRIVTASGVAVLSLTYNDRAPWPVAADGHGFSLVPRAEAPRNSDFGFHWRASSAGGGSPGTDDPNPSILPIHVNELFSRSDTTAVDWVELFNPNPIPVDVSGWFLSDDGGLPQKYRIPQGTFLPASGYLTFTEASFNSPPESALAFSFNSSGDSIYLSSGDANTNLTGYSHAFEFGAAPLDGTFGRVVISTGEEQFPILVQPTPGASNTPPRVGPVVINEIHYHPGTSGPEFVELRNISGSMVSLFDPAAPTNTWRLEGLSFQFPTNVLLPPNGLLLIAGIDPDAFRAHWGVAPGMPILGPFAGTLQDSGEKLELQQPEFAGTNGVLYVTVDAVRYNDRAPWPPAADGGGASLQRRQGPAYGNDPSNWTAAPPTPGASYLPGLQAPRIIGPPTDVTVVATREAVFNVLAEGDAPLFHQWLYENSPIQNATSATLVLSNVQPAQAGRYSVIVFNAGGSVQSTGAHLTVLAPAFIVNQPKGIQVRIPPDPQAAPSTNVTFNVAATSSSPLRYQWLFNGMPIFQATNSLLTVSNVQLRDEGNYVAAITDDAGTIFSAPAYLQPWISPSIVLAPVSQNVAVGSPVTLSVQVEGNPAPFTYEWRLGSLGVQTNSGRGKIDFFSFVATNVPRTNVYRVVVKNAANVTPGFPSPFAAIATLPDLDGDGLPDAWELANGFDPANAGDRNGDRDGDGMSNGDEYTAGTDPADPASYLKLEPLTNDRPVTLHFGAISNRTYVIQSSDGLGRDWESVAAIPARISNRVERVLDPSFTTNRFYRVATPGALTP